MNREKIENNKDAINYMYCVEGKSKLLISKILKLDRKLLTHIINDEWKLIQGHQNYLKPSLRKFLNKNKQKIKSMLNKDISINQIAKSLNTNIYTINKMINYDKSLKQEKELYLNRIKENHNNLIAKKKKESKFIYDFKNVDDEQWKQILGNENYFISNYGRVKLYKKRYNSYILLRPEENKNTKRLYAKIGEKSYNLARLVAFNFIEGYNEKNNTVNHKDGDIKNNYYQNLEWVSQSENNKHSYRTLKRKKNKGYSKYGRFKKIILDEKYEFSTILALSKFLHLSTTQTYKLIEKQDKHSFRFIY